MGPNKRDIPFRTTRLLSQIVAPQLGHSILWQSLGCCRIKSFCVTLQSQTWSSGYDRAELHWSHPLPAPLPFSCHLTTFSLPWNTSSSPLSMLPLAFLPPGCLGDHHAADHWCSTNTRPMLAHAELACLFVAVLQGCNIWVAKREMGEREERERGAHS